MMKTAEFWDFNDHAILHDLALNWALLALNELKYVDDHPGRQTPKDHSDPVHPSHGRLLQTKIC
jgi:hypothetical protein